MYFRLTHVPRGTSRRHAREGPTAPSRALAPQSRPTVPTAPGTPPCVHSKGRERRAAQSRLVRFGCAAAGADGRWAQGRVWGWDPRYGFLAPDRWGGSRGSRQAKSEGLERPGRSLSSGSRVLALGAGGRETGGRRAHLRTWSVRLAPGAAACSSSRRRRIAQSARPLMMPVMQEGTRRAPSASLISFWGSARSTRRGSDAGVSTAAPEALHGLFERDQAYSGLLELAGGSACARSAALAPYPTSQQSEALCARRRDGMGVSTAAPGLRDGSIE